MSGQFGEAGDSFTIAVDLNLLCPSGRDPECGHEWVLSAALFPDLALVLPVRDTIFFHSRSDKAPLAVRNARAAWHRVFRPVSASHSDWHTHTHTHTQPYRHSGN